MIARTVIASAALLAANAAIAAAPAQQPPSEETAGSSAGGDAEAEAEVAAEKKICRSEKATGSLTRRTRICLTATQWREIQDRTRRGVDEMNSGASGGKMCVPNPNDPFQGCAG